MEPERLYDDAFSNGGATAASTRPSAPPRQPNYTCTKVQEALEHLASIDPIELCNEAKVEHCRATRDLRSCGRYVQSVLNTCGHASLCEECSQRCDVCPICRVTLAKDGNRLRLRLYYECVEACLISKRCDDRLQDKEDSEKELIADVQHLYSLFDVALENNLSSLICQYITDVCMDESAVSSDPVIAFLLDEVVVKDWCRRRFKNILAELQVIYNLTVAELKESFSSLLKFSVKLAGLANVLDVLESSLKGSLPEKLHDLCHLQENILKTKQHMEVITWCVRHQFLENVRSRHANMASWRSHVRERKSSAIKRAWPNLVTNPASESFKPDSSTLFIEEALSNLDTDPGHTDNHGEDLQIALLQKDGGSLFFRSKLEGLAGLYPFESLRAAIDVLFLRGSSDLVVSKQAIFLYYLFDRHWTIPEEKWRDVVDDFAATFSVTRHSLLESFVFYLLDDHTDEALKEACRLLPEISGPTVHPKVAKVLLERQNPDAALMVMRWSGQDGARLISFEEAVTTVRVQVECGLLTEAFMYQRAVCIKVKEHKLGGESFQNASGETKGDCWTCAQWVEVMVTEICCLCIRRNLIDQMIELPWNFDEEKHLHKCLLDFAADDPSSTMGSLLVVFYLQRYRYIEAYEVDRKLTIMEQDFISMNSVSEQTLIRMRSMSHWRSALVEKSIELLPDVLQQQLKNGNLPKAGVLFSNEGGFPAKSNGAKEQGPILTSLLVPHLDSSFVHGIDNAMTPPKNSVLNTSSILVGSVNIHANNDGNFGASIPPARFFSEAEKGPRPESSLKKKFRFDNVRSATHLASPATSPMREVNSSSSSGKVRSVHRQNGSVNKFHSQSSYLPRTVANSVTPLRGNQGMLEDFAQDSSVQGKLAFSDTTDLPRMPLSNDSMDISWSHDEGGLSVKRVDANGGPRWRSDDSSDDEDHQNQDRLTVAVTNTRNRRGVRRGRILGR